MRITSLFAALSAVSLIACSRERAPASAQTAESTVVATITSSEARTNLFSNEYVEVFTITLGPGKQLPPHPGGARAIYALSDYTVRLTQNGETTEQSWKIGEAHAHGAGEHSLENIGTTEAKLLVVMRTGQTLSPSGVTLTPPKTTPSGSGPSKMLLSNDDFAVAEVRLPAGATLPRHPGLARIVYSLSDYTISYTSNDLPAKSQSFTTGETHWHEADEHVITNTGATEARFMMVQFKR